MADPAKLAFTGTFCAGPCFYRATFRDGAADTFLDTSAFGKGEVWLNGRPLGRIWNIGPQKTLYVPGPWLQPGENEFVVFDLNGGSAQHSLGGINRSSLPARRDNQV